ncbi:XTP/dITP diphosphohydrolase [Pseudomonas duriflava]|uniref:XTP/dITP diphosphohydrolase n=1 Tax=Pseudomonas duriflava TaxID=459528 RepID=A0A562QAD6_9PSED|nr:non-canonical purine NTP pyrophosphatase [Pseudomonas duriflava]TWI53717.1 XTP/dITP diphosphohydrolase [Pseudomonas duriflava]
MKIRFVSSNTRKVEEVRTFLSHRHIEITTYEVKLEELQTEDVQRLVSDKLLKAFQLIGKPVFVEHTGLYIKSLNDFPAGLTQLFWDKLQAERFTTIIGNLDDPSAVAKTLIGYCDGRKKYFFEGETSGRITEQPAGDPNLEWDCVFMPAGVDKTLAELGTERLKYSMRCKALEAFANFLQEH